MFTGTARVCGVLDKLRHGCRSLKAARVAGYQAAVSSAKIMLVKSAVFTLQVYCVFKTIVVGFHDDCSLFACLF